MARRFPKVAKTARGTPKKYVRVLTTKGRLENEIASTAKKYKAGTLTKSQMDAIVKKRVASGKKKR